MLVHGQSALQLGVFAAPRSEGIWDEVREEIRQSLLADGAAAQEVEGEYGTELHAQVRTEDGLTDLRFVGVDGPRWMVRAVYQGAAATDPAAAGPLAHCLDGLVVDRGWRPSRYVSRCRYGCRARRASRWRRGTRLPGRQAPRRRPEAAERSVTARCRRGCPDRPYGRFRRAGSARSGVR
ncbi:hypothetical protein GCM10029963_27400 [Micromonospora andamanensis]